MSGAARESRGPTRGDAALAAALKRAQLASALVKANRACIEQQAALLMAEKDAPVCVLALLRDARVGMQDARDALAAVVDVLAHEAR